MSGCQELKDVRTYGHIRRMDILFYVLLKASTVAIFEKRFAGQREAIIAKTGARIKTTPSTIAAACESAHAGQVIHPVGTFGLLRPPFHHK